MPKNNTQIQAVTITVKGIVQGVGFRPFIYRTALSLGLSGTCSNTSQGVKISLQGSPNNIQKFKDTLVNTPPPLARIDSIEIQDTPVDNSLNGFSINPSQTGGPKTTLPPPDYATCENCLKELFDPKDRRYKYAFINCTDCGPRFTIINALPYDRHNTSMSVFNMCDQCRKEYLNPRDRRFHAEPIACPVCGPEIYLLDSKGKKISCSDPIDTVASALKQGQIVAIKGLGGFHLAVDATSYEAVARLRDKKNRPYKPLAIMVPDIETASELAHLTTESQEKLCGNRAPIVIIPKKQDSKLAQNIAPGITNIGIMLPYTPLHHLIIKHPDTPKALVMTSANISGLPVCSTTEDALLYLSNIADIFLTHNREIITRADDSVIRSVKNTSISIRRSRGFVPEPVFLPDSSDRSILGCGGAMKTTFCLIKDNMAFLSQHIGDLAYEETQQFYKKSLKYFSNLFDIQPEICAIDLHPDYATTRIGLNSGIECIKIQHHHAHAVSVMAEHGINDPVIAIILDGTGLGPDGTIWGGEILRVDSTNFKRLAHLEYLPLPGGDKAAQEPWRMGISLLYKTELINMAKKINIGLLNQPSINLILQLIKKQINTPKTSSCGRLFDAVSSILGGRKVISYEAQAAMEFESMASKTYKNLSKILNLPVEIDSSGEVQVIKLSKMVKGLLTGIKMGVSSEELAMSFHNWLVSSIITCVQQQVKRLHIKKIVLSGGCLQNGILLSSLITELKRNNLDVYWGESIPMSDAGISLGQAVIAMHLQKNR